MFLRTIYEKPAVPIPDQLGLYHLLGIFWSDVLQTYNKIRTGNIIPFSRSNLILTRSYVPRNSSITLLGYRLVSKYEEAFTLQMAKVTTGVPVLVEPELSLAYFGDTFYNDTVSRFSKFVSKK